MARMLLLVGCLATLLAAVPCAAQANFDTFDDETLNDVNAFGQEVPYTSGDTRQFTASFDTSAFTLQAGEGGSTGNVNGCTDPDEPGGYVFAGRTGWVRFDPAVDGKITVVAQTPGYDSVIMIRPGKQAAWRTSSFSDVRGQPGENCDNSINGPGDEDADVQAVKDRVYHVQVGGKCPSQQECENDPNAAPGGQTTIRLTFVPDDTDEDGVANTNDECVGGERGKVTDRGCADTDGDRIRDDQEGPGCVGQQGVPSEDPDYNGCFEGPDPPIRGKGAQLVVEAPDGNPELTTTKEVVLVLNWRKGTREAFADNGDGRGERPIPLQARVPWELGPSQQAGHREVNVRFVGPNFEEHRHDGIGFDVIAPTVDRQVVVRSGGAKPRWFVGGRAADDPGGTGVRRVEVLDADRRPLKAFGDCAVARCPVLAGQVIGLRTRPRFIRAVDAAGNERVVQLSGAKTCTRRKEIYVPKLGGGGDCFRVGERCRSSTPYWKGSDLRCVNGKVVSARKKRRSRRG